ncbi:unnamed protein product [Meloidogyne enterolobii]|uniref:Uncharacterized protein n=1 Tax=Meloidogyne enterolobii TaxID=390850 RepID=A0ACB1A4R6_MELEN
MLFSTHHFSNLFILHFPVNFLLSIPPIILFFFSNLVFFDQTIFEFLLIFNLI